MALGSQPQEYFGKAICESTAKGPFLFLSDPRPVTAATETCPMCPCSSNEIFQDDLHSFGMPRRQNSLSKHSDDDAMGSCPRSTLGEERMLRKFADDCARHDLAETEQAEN